MRSILVQAGRDAQNSVRLDSAMEVARAREGHVTLLIDTPIDRFVTVDPYGGTYVAREALEAAVADDNALAELFEGRLANEDVPFDVAKFETAPVEAMAAVGKLADLIVVSQGCGFAGDLAVEARCPVLVLPQDKPLRLPLTTACIAWDGGEQAAVALRSAVPLLQSCANVHVLTVLDTAAGGFPPTDALRYLARHGITSELHEKGGAAGPVGPALIAVASQLRAQYLVMGAYGHTRAREYLFGGVTRDLLKDSPIIVY